MNDLAVIRKIGDEFGLEFKKDAFTGVLLTPRVFALASFAHGLPDPAYIKLLSGKNRWVMLPKFAKSALLKKKMKEKGGFVISKRAVESYLSEANKIPDERLKKELASFLKKLLSKFKDNEYLVLYSAKTALLRAFINILINTNGLDFPSISNDAWKWNEGLITFFNFFVSGKPLKDAKPKSEFDKTCVNYALKWNNLLKDALSNIERHNVLFNKFNELKLNSLTSVIED